MRYAIFFGCLWAFALVGAAFGLVAACIAVALTAGAGIAEEMYLRRKERRA